MFTIGKYLDSGTFPYTDTAVKLIVTKLLIVTCSIHGPHLITALSKIVHFL